MQQVTKGKLNSNSRHVLDSGERSRADCFMTADTTLFQGRIPPPTPPNQIAHFSSIFCCVFAEEEHTSLASHSGRNPEALQLPKKLLVHF